MGDGAAVNPAEAQPVKFQLRSVKIDRFRQLSFSEPVSLEVEQPDLLREQDGEIGFAPDDEVFALQVGCIGTEIQGGEILGRKAGGERNFAVDTRRLREDFPT